MLQLRKITCNNKREDRSYYRKKEEKEENEERKMEIEAIMLPTTV
jgi:hypothetical protein